MIRKEKDEISWLEFKIFQDFPLKHAYFLKHGGVSEHPYGFNFSTFNGDTLSNVEFHVSSMKRLLCSEDIARSMLVHGDGVAVVEKAIEEKALTADGLITAKTGLILLTTFADCQCTLLYDPKKHVVANVHSGWRGNVQNIYGATVRRLQEVYGCNPQDLVAGVGPSLGPKFAEFKNYRSELPESFLKYRCGECHFNLWNIARGQLEEAGILPENIEIAGICTYEQKEDFFSYRREKVTGRHAGVIMLKDKG